MTYGMYHKREIKLQDCAEQTSKRAFIYMALAVTSLAQPDDVIKGVRVLVLVISAKQRTDGKPNLAPKIKILDITKMMIHD